MSAASAERPSSSVLALTRPFPPRTWPAAVSALAVRDYRLFLSSQVLATTGLWMQRIAQDWLVLELTGSVAAVGFTVALQFLPVLLLGLVGGVIADRFPKRLILMVTQSVAALMAVTLGVLALTHLVAPWHVFVVATLLGLVTVVDNPTRQVYVSELVGPDRIRNAVSLNSSVFQFGALVGPALSGILITAVGQGWSFLLNAAACLVVVGMLVTIGRTGTQPSSTRPRAEGSVREGLTYIARNSEIAWSIALVAIMGLLGLNMPVILTAFADSVFDTGVTGYSLFNSLTALGALAGAIWSARRTRTLQLRALVATLAGLGGVFALAALAPSRWLFAALLVGTGLLTLSFLTGANALVQTRSPSGIRGRVMSVYILVLLGGQAVGGPVVGWLVDHIGARSTLFTCGALIIVAALSCAAAMARQAHLGLELDLRRRLGHLPVHIVHH